MFNRTQVLLGAVLIHELYQFRLTWRLKKAFHELCDNHEIQLKVRDIQVDELVRVLERHNVPREEFESVIAISTPRSK
jgi:hypothetical protein